MQDSLKKTKNCKTIRPLLSVNRFETGKFCSYWQLPIYPDLSNQKVRFSRNRVRKQIIPLIKLFFNSKVENGILQLAEIVAAEDQHLANVSKDIFSCKRPDNVSRDRFFPAFERDCFSLKRGARFFQRYNRFLYNSKLANVKIREKKSKKENHASYTNVFPSREEKRSEEKESSQSLKESSLCLEKRAKQKVDPFQCFLSFQTLSTFEVEDIFYTNCYSCWPFILSVLPPAFQRRVTKLFLESKEYKKIRYVQIEKIAKKLLTSPSRTAR